MDEKIKKLPRWAQDLIRKKDYDINDLQAFISGLEGSNEHSNINYDPLIIGGKKIYIPDHLYVKFILGEGHGKTIQVGIRKNKLHIAGNTRIGIEPNASNTVDISIID